MEWNRFWKVLEDAARPDGLDQLESLKSELDRLKWFEVVEFQVRFEEALAAANRLELWGAAIVINGGCTERGFRDFRAWLVGRGRTVYEAALEQPDSLADVLDGDPVDGFGLDAAAVRIYEAKTGSSDFYERLEPVKAPFTEGLPIEFEDADAMKKRYPKLFQLYFEELL